MRGGAQAGCRAECRVRCGAKRGAGGEGGVEGGVEDNAVRGGVRWEEAKKWRAKSLRTPFYQYSIYNQKDVLIIRLIIHHFTSRMQRTLPFLVSLSP